MNNLESIPTNTVAIFDARRIERFLTARGRRILREEASNYPWDYLNIDELRNDIIQVLELGEEIFEELISIDDIKTRSRNFMDLYEKVFEKRLEAYQKERQKPDPRALEILEARRVADKRNHDAHLARKKALGISKKKRKKEAMLQKS